VRWRGRVVRSAIWKTPLVGRVQVTRFNLEGDRQADPAFHGGAEKAIYVYPSEHYAYWRPRLGDLPWGAFGENFTTEGLLEHEVHVGDELRIGSVVLLEVTQPRTPCAKLAMRFERPGIVREFERSRRSGFYCAVRHAGDVAAGDPIAWGVRARGMPAVAELLDR
jgi:MOSC domain-containing protein YiiM